MIYKKLDNYFYGTRQKKADKGEIDPYILQNSQVLTTIYGKGVIDKLNIEFLQKEIGPFFPFFQKGPQGINQLLLEKMTSNQNARFILAPGINIIEDNQGQFFSSFAMGLLSHPQNIKLCDASVAPQVELDFSINEILFNLKRNGNNLDSVELNHTTYRNLSEAQNQIALQLNIHHLSKRKTTFGLNVFDNTMFIDLHRQPRDFKEIERIFLFGSPEIREKLYIYHILKITAEFYGEQMERIRNQMSTLNSGIENLRIVNKQKMEEKANIKGELEKLGISGGTEDQIEKIYLEKIREKTIFERQLELHEKNQGFVTQQVTSSGGQLLTKERKLNDRVNEIKNKIEKLRRDQDNLFNSRQALKTKETNLGLEIFKGRSCSCGFTINDAIADERVKNGKCPICGNIPPDQEERKAKLNQLDQEIKESKEKDNGIQEEVESLQSIFDINKMQLESLQKIVKRTNEEILADKSDEIHYSIVEASQKLIEITNFVNSIDTIRSWNPRIHQLDFIISQNKKQIEDDESVIKSYNRRMRKVGYIYGTLNARLKNILNMCRSSFKTQAMELGITLGEFMGQLISQFNPDQLDKKRDILMNLNYLDVIRSINQPGDSISTRLFYFIALLKMSLNGHFTMPNLYIITGITMEDLEKFRDVFAQLDQNYKGLFQIIFLIKGDLQSKNLPASWYKTSRGSRNPYQGTL